MSERAAGILMPISSLPSEYGIGCFSKSAYEFVDWLKKAGQSYWQILPLGPTSYGDSPYQSFSTFAGNPYFISLEALVEEGVLTKAECEAVDWGKVKGSIDYKKIYEGRYPLLRKAYERSKVHENAEYQKFVEENSWWLSDYALFMAVKDRFDGVEWKLWADDIKLRWGPAMDYYREELYFDIEFQQYMQFKFYEQWMQLKAYANKKGIQITADPAYRSNLWKYGKNGHEVLKELVSYSTIFIGGVNEINEILATNFSSDKAGFIEASKTLMQQIPSIKKVFDKVRIGHSATNQSTKGRAWVNETYIETNELAIENVVDRIGTGDAYAAGLIYGLIHYTEQEALDFANAACAIKHTILGDINLATASDISEIVNGNLGGRIKR